VEAGQAATAPWTTVFTIGLGNKLDFDLLERMARQPRNFHRASNAECFAGIYREIERLIPGPPVGSWGGGRMSGAGSVRRIRSRDGW